MLMNNRKWKSVLLFHPMTISRHGQWYRFITSGFIHADMMHLAINMFVLWSFGSVIEQVYYPHFLGGGSTTKYLILYFSGIIVSSIPSYIRHKNDPTYAALGDYDINKIYVEKESLEACGLSVDDLMHLTWEDEDEDWAEKDSIKVVSSTELAELMDQQDVVFSF